jgi:hypothetical protein
MHTPMTRFIREIMHEIILNQVRFVNFISKLLATCKYKNIASAFFSIASQRISGINNEPLHIKTRPNHTAVKIRTSQNNE